MKVLSIVWYKILPPLFGGQKGIALFNKYLARHYPLTCICSHNNEILPDPGYNILPMLPANKFQFINPLVISKLAAAASKENPSHIILEHPYHAFSAFRIKKTTGAKLVLHSHNIESQRFRMLGKWWWRVIEWFEKRVYRESDFIIFKTPEDRKFAITRFGVDADKTMIIPYGIDPERKKPDSDARQSIREKHHISPGERILLFSGTLDYRPNARAVENIFQIIAPCLAEKKIPARIIITGRNHHPSFRHLRQLSHPAVIMAGEVTDMENYFAAADLFINPVEDPSGIQTKIIDALSYHLPVVCFSNALNGINTSLCPDKIFIARSKDYPGFAGQVASALQAKHAETPAEFFNCYSFPSGIEKFAARLKSL